MLLGIAYRAQGSPELLGEAVAELRQAIALKPSLALPRLALARVYLDMARATRAREELEVALEQLPGDPQLLSLLGETERRLGHASRSVELNELRERRHRTTVPHAYTVLQNTSTLQRSSLLCHPARGALRLDAGQHRLEGALNVDCGHVARADPDERLARAETARG